MTYLSMAATHSLQEEVQDRNFDFFDALLTLNEFHQSEEDDAVRESCSSSRPEYAKSSIANYRASSASPLEAWINEEFGDDEEASPAMHDEADSYRALIRQVGMYVDSVDFVPGTTYSDGDHVDADGLHPHVDLDVEMFYEPQLWCFI